MSRNNYPRDGDDKIQPGNPHQLTKKQHVPPRACIRAFSNNDGKVEVFDKNYESIALRDPNEPRFSAERVWDQRSEEFSECKFERPYLRTVRAIRENIPSSINGEDQRRISAMYGLWRIRAHLRLSRPTGIPLGLDNPPVDNGWTKDETEQLEKAGFVFTRSDNLVLGRLSTWPRIDQFVRQTVLMYEQSNWVVCIAQDGHFVCPDSPPNTPIFPCAPDLCFVLERPSLETQTLDRTVVSNINQRLAENADIYYFARCISSCPFPN